MNGCSTKMSVAPSLLTSKADIARAVSFDSKARKATREMKLYCPEAALGPQPVMIDKAAPSGLLSPSKSAAASV